MSMLPPPWSDDTRWGLTNSATALLTIIFPKNPEERKRDLPLDRLFDRFEAELFELQLAGMFTISWEPSRAKPGKHDAIFTPTAEGRLVAAMAQADSMSELRPLYDKWRALTPSSGQTQAELVAELMMLTADARKLERELADAMSELRAGKGAAA